MESNVTLHFLIWAWLTCLFLIEKSKVFRKCKSAFTLKNKAFNCAATLDCMKNMTHGRMIVNTLQQKKKKEMQMFCLSKFAFAY